MNSAQRLHLAWSAETARLAGMPGSAENLERKLSDVMVADYQAWAAAEAERQIAEHHRRRPRFR